MAINNDGINLGNIKGPNEGSIQFDDSAEVGSVETRLAAARTLAEDLNRSGETAFEHEIIVSGSKWRIVIEKL